MKNETPATVATATAIDLNDIVVQPLTGRCANKANAVYNAMVNTFGVEKAVALFAARLVQSEQARIVNSIDVDTTTGKGTKGSEEKPSLTAVGVKGKDKFVTTWTLNLVHAVEHLDKATAHYLVIQSATLAPHIVAHLGDIKRRLLSGEASI